MNGLKKITLEPFTFDVDIFLFLSWPAFSFIALKRFCLFCETHFFSNMIECICNQIHNYSLMLCNQYDPSFCSDFCSAVMVHICIHLVLIYISEWYHFPNCLVHFEFACFIFIMVESPSRLLPMQKQRDVDWSISDAPDDESNFRPFSEHFEAHSIAKGVIWIALSNLKQSVHKVCATNLVLILYAALSLWHLSRMLLNRQLWKKTKCSIDQCMLVVVLCVTYFWILKVWRSRVES